MIGEGPQKGGGYSVAVKALYETDNSIVIRTELQGPEAGEAKGTEDVVSGVDREDGVSG